MKDKVVVITGAGSGIGKACAICFADQGATVIVADIILDNAKITADLINSQAGRAFAYQTDVSNESSVKLLAAAVLQDHGPVSVLVNNAAIQINKTVEQTSFGEWSQQLAVNLGGVFLCSREFLPQLRSTKGSIVNMSSVNGFFVEPTCAGYCATKAGIIGLTKAMAIDHGHDGIRVNCICPGYIDAGLAEGYFQSQADPAQARQDAGKLHALGRIGKAEEVGKVAVFLGSDGASFVTGSVMVVDGGFGSGLPPK